MRQQQLLIGVSGMLAILLGGFLSHGSSGLTQTSSSRVSGLTQTLWPLSRMVADTYAASPPTRITAPRDTVMIQRPAPAADPRPDLYGNEVDNAVAEYQIDTGGSLYELHSPETAVLKLQPPTM